MDVCGFGVESSPFSELGVGTCGGGLIGDCGFGFGFVLVLLASLLLVEACDVVDCAPNFASLLLRIFPILADAQALRAVLGGVSSPYPHLRLYPT